MTDMLDRIAEAIDPVAFMPMSVHLTKTHKAAAMDKARERAVALLRVLREPDEEMVERALVACDRNGYAVSRGMVDDRDVKTAFTAMIDAILPKEEKGE